MSWWKWYFSWSCNWLITHYKFNYNLLEEWICLYFIKWEITNCSDLIDLRHNVPDTLYFDNSEELLRILRSNYFGDKGYFTDLRLFGYCNNHILDFIFWNFHLGFFLGRMLWCTVKFGKLLFLDLDVIQDQLCNIFVLFLRLVQRLCFFSHFC